LIDLIFALLDEIDPLIKRSSKPAEINEMKRPPCTSMLRNTAVCTALVLIDYSPSWPPNTPALAALIVALIASGSVWSLPSPDM